MNNEVTTKMVTMHVASDGQEFASLLDAHAHQAELNVREVLDAYIQFRKISEGAGRARTENTIIDFEKFRARQTFVSADVVVGPVPE